MAFLALCCKSTCPEPSYWAYGYAVFLLTPHSPTSAPLCYLHSYGLCCSHQATHWSSSKPNTIILLAAIQVHHVAVLWDFCYHFCACWL